jgi:hypothetical protein
LLRGSDDLAAAPHAAKIVDGLAENRKPRRRNTVRRMFQPLGLTNRKLIVDPAVLRKKLVTEFVVGRDDYIRRAANVFEILTAPWICFDNWHM